MLFLDVCDVFVHFVFFHLLPQMSVHSFFLKA